MKGKKDPELAQLMERMRYELARELGLDAVQTGDFGSVSSKACGTYGRLLQRRATQLVNGVEEAVHGEAIHDETPKELGPAGDGGAKTKRRPVGPEKRKKSSTSSKSRTR